MSKLLEDQVHFLGMLQTASKEQRKALLKTIDKQQLKALSEIAHNVIKGTVVLSTEEKKKLKKYKKLITILGRKSRTRRDRLRALQRGSTGIVLLVKVIDPRLWRK